MTNWRKFWASPKGQAKKKRKTDIKFRRKYESAQSWERKYGKHGAKYRFEDE